MFDWWQVGANAVWILGAALLLATFSTRRYEAATARASATSNLPAPQSWPYGVGLLLVSLGLCASSSTLRDQLLWGLLSLIILIVTGLSIRDTARGPRTEPAPPEDR